MKPGDALGRFVVVRRIGAGAMGTVYEARDPELARSVAIKLVGDPEEHLELRLQREAQALAQLQHPNVVAVHELGVHRGQMFIAMEMVDGVDLAGHLIIDDRSWREIVSLFIDAGHGLAAVHAKGIVHRDIKPSNLLVDAAGRVRVSDFGLARLVGDDGHAMLSEPPDELFGTASTVDGWGPELGAARRDVSTPKLATQIGHGSDPDETRDTTRDDAERPALATPLTRVGAIIGTPYYMAPEQLRGHRASSASDQFSFCVAMWCALFESHPFGDPAIPDRRGGGRAQADKVLADVGPAVIAGRRRPTATRGVPRWLVRLLDRGLSVDPSKRYPSMDALVRELEQRVRKRRPVAIALAAAALVIAGVTAWLVIAAHRRDARDADDRTARDDVQIVAHAAAALDTDPAKALALVGTLSNGSPSWRAARMVIADAIERGASRVIETKAKIFSLAVSPDTSLVVGIDDTNLRVWDTRTLAERWAIGIEPRSIAAVGFAPDTVVVASFDGAVVLRDRATGTVKSQRMVAGEFNRASISPTGRYVLLMGVGDAQTILVDLERSERRIGPYYNAAWSPDGKIAVLYDRHLGKLDRLDVTTGEVTPWVANGQLQGVVLSLATDGVRAWTGGWKGSVTTYLGGVASPRNTDHSGPVMRIVPTADGHLITACATFPFEGGGDPDIGTADAALTISDDNSAHLVHLRGHKAEIDAVATAGDLIASSDRGGALRLWRRPPTFVVPKNRITVGASTGDAAQIAIGRRGPILEVVDLAQRRVDRMYITSGPPGYAPPEPGMAGGRASYDGRTFVELFERGDAAVTAIARSTSGRIVATLDSKNQVVVWDTTTQQGRLLAAKVVRMALAPDGSHVVTVDTDDTVRVWTLASNTSAQLPMKISRAVSIACSIDCAAFAIAADGTVVLQPGGERLTTEDDHLLTVAMSGDGDLVVAGGDSRDVHTWALGRRDTRTLTGASSSITHVEILADGRVAAAGRDGTIQLWNLAAGDAAPDTTLRGHTGEIRSLTLRGDLLVTTSADRTARVWDLTAGTSRAVGGPDQFASVTDDGHIAGVDTLDTLVWFSDDLPAEETGLRDWLARWSSSGTMR